MFELSAEVVVVVGRPVLVFVVVSVVLVVALAVVLVAEPMWEN